jgi:hypothetical protein
VLLVAAAAGLAVLGVSRDDHGSTQDAGASTSVSASAAPAPAGSTGTPTSAPSTGQVSTTTTPSTSTSTSTSQPVPGPTDVATDPAPVTDAPTVQVTLARLEWDDATGTLRANGFAAGVIEDGGTCVLTARSASGVTVSAETTGMADATTTNCGQLETRAGSMSSGTWQVTLAYSSPGTTGTSSAQAVVVP